ncbi:MAG: DUF4295 domain-containing protein [Bacteroidia bacterium]|nr:DUF4295 domain-containing protein [Bacteroidia bacterium]
MAKKVVAGYRDKSKVKTFTKVIQPVKNPETGAYTFKEDVIPSDMVQEFLKEQKK